MATGTWTRARYLEPVFVPGSRWAAPYITYYYTWRNEKPVLAVRSHDTPWLVSDAWQPTNYNNSVYIEVFWGTSVAVTDENGAQKEYRYDMNGALIAVNPDAGDTSARNLYYNRFLDSNLRRIAFGSSCGDSISFLYDALGQLLYESNYYSSIPALQYSTLYSYDPVGNRTGLLFQSSSLPSIQSSTAYAYDCLDRLTNVCNVDAAARRVSAGYSFADPAGNLVRKSYNNGVYTDYAYDARGRLTGLTNRTQSAILDAYQYEYDTATMISAITRNQQKMSFTYDKTYQLTAELGRYLTNAAGGSLATATVSNQFAYDAAGNRVQLCQILDGKARVDNYTHTADNQLTGIYWNASKLTLRGIVQDCWTANWVKVKQSTAATWVPAQLTLRKGHDVAWVATNVPVSDTGTLTFNIEAQITNNFVITQSVQYKRGATVADPGNITYTYDANGNRIEKWTNSLFAARYFYDTDNQLLGISFDNDQNHTDAGDYTYAYDPFGRRISATEDNVTRYFAYDDLDCIAELNTSANVTKWYVRGAGLGGGIGDIVAEVRPTSTNYYCYNHRGDVVGLVSKSGIVTARFEYTAFGLPTTEYRTPNTEYRCIGFSSKEFDARSGLSYYGFRYYDAESGRWMTKEPNGDDGPNPYWISFNNPVKLIDIYGLWGEDGHAVFYSFAFKTDYAKNLQMLDHLHDITVGGAAAHYMAEPNEGPSVTKAKIAAIEKKSVSDAKIVAEQGLCCDALYYLIPAFHAIQDSYSPVHNGSAGPIEWHGSYGQWRKHGPSQNPLTQEGPELIQFRDKAAAKRRMSTLVHAAFDGSNCHAEDFVK